MKSLAALALIVAGAASLPLSAHAQSVTMTFDLDDVWLLPDVSNPGAPAQHSRCLRDR